MLWFSNLDPRVSSRVLNTQFKHCVGFLGASVSGKAVGMGHVEFDNSSNALKALKEFNGTSLLGVRLQIGLQSPTEASNFLGPDHGRRTSK